MPIYLALQNTYHNVQCALFHDSELKAASSLDKFQASALLIPHIKDLLTSADYPMNGLDFIAVNQGPGPFTTLRTVIATANGLAWASGIPLIGIDGLDALLQEFQEPGYETTLALLNAFNHDVYYGIKTAQGVRTGVMNHQALLRELIKTEGLIRCIGNGAQLYKKELEDILGDRAIFPNPMPETCSIEQIGLLGLHGWHAGVHPSTQLQPLYLKSL